ncbi:MAG: glycosyltransferase N-terminal domain-containing protein [Desulfosalsimonas sp.]
MNQTGLKIALKIYDTAWRAFMPALRISSRLKEGYDGRSLAADLPAADLWIQAASGGEAYLAWSILSALNPPVHTRVLVTTNTGQGMEILQKAALQPGPANPSITIMTAWFPFDRPSVMRKAVCQVNPKLVVFLETEIWPGLLYALKSGGRPAWIINGRLTEKSFSRYRRGSGLLRMLRPEGVLCVSDADAARFSKLFGKDIVSEMTNIKFDKLPALKPDQQQQALPGILAPESKFLVLGSIRKEEEAGVRKLMENVRGHYSDVVIGLFPRHMHRLEHWKLELKRMNTPWVLRSQMSGPAEPGSVILWDTFGELSEAYWAADSVFVGGSLAPLGGQNFLEPLLCGCQPVMGPSWDNFFWVGEDVFSQGLVLKESNWQAAARRLVEQLQNPPDREKIRAKAVQYISARQGGTKKACGVIEKYLEKDPRKEAL